MRRRFGADVFLAILLPVACGLALLLLHPDRDEPRGKTPVETALTSASVVCPDALPGTGSDLLGVSIIGADPDTKVKGDVQVGLGPSAAPLALRTRRVSAAPPLGPTVITGSDDLAPGLVAGRSQSVPLAAVDCAPPVADQWFTAVGAGATHDSVVELVNPNAGPAIADITVRSPSGILEVPALHGVSVPGNDSVRLDLGQVTPHRNDRSLEVHTSRGRLSVHVVDTYDDLGAGASGQDWLPAQAEPATDNLLLGLATGKGERTLVLANPGADEVRATVKVVTPTSVFAPSGVDEVRVAPDTTEAVSLDDVLAQATRAGATGLLVEASGPVTATMRQVVGGDLSLLSTAPELDGSSAVVLPAGPKHLLLAGADAVGAATVTSYSADGKQLDQQRVELGPESGADLALPDDA
ncbi:MAG: hypothetical protein QOD98_4098, partial [Nocardioidaceae bacterium]|nr:hypothetical protein [Nocardioidaceae bacterium]